MSTNEPPAGAAPNGAPEYGQPQDPWAGGFDYSPGQASVPTDPIPNQYDPYGSYTQYGNPDPWSQATAQQGGGQQWMPPPVKKTIPVLYVVIVLVLLAAGGGAAAWYVATHAKDKGTDGTTTAASTTKPPESPATSVPPTSAGPPSFDPTQMQVNDCVANAGTADKPKMAKSECVTGAFKIIKIVTGADIKQDDDGTLSKPEVQATCKDTAYQFYYKNDFSGIDRDIVFCMTVQP